MNLSGENDTKDTYEIQYYYKAIIMFTVMWTVMTKYYCYILFKKPSETTRRIQNATIQKMNEETIYWRAGCSWVYFLFVRLWLAWSWSLQN